MISFLEWFKLKNIRTEESWLILGKGPSFSERDRYDLSLYHTIGLNHVCREQPVLIAHAIDLEVVETLGYVLLDKCRYLVMPWVPHIRYRPYPFRKRVSFKPSDLDLPEYCKRIPVLKKMESEGRLLWYNSSTSTRSPSPNSPVVEVQYFSVTGALNLLAMAGVKHIRSLGVDGGNTYSTSFDDLKDKTLLVAGQKSYDRQFQEIRRTLMKTGIDFAPLNVESPIKVYVGTQIEQMLATKVLEFSIRKHTSMSVEVIPLSSAISQAGIKIPKPKKSRLRPRTPFSFQRFAIPALKGYKGRAIYLDSDMQVFKDIKELWLWPFNNADILSIREPDGSGRPSQFSVMVLNCDQLDWDVEKLVGRLERGEWNYDEFVYRMGPANSISEILPSEWNDLERYTEGKTALSHYTDMHDQPWLSTENLLARIWCEALFEAVESGFISVDYIKSDIEKSWIRPSLLYQLENNIVDPILLPKSVIQRDYFEFTAPPSYRELMKKITEYGNPNPSHRSRYARKVYAFSRHIWKKSGAKGLRDKIKRHLA